MDKVTLSRSLASAFGAPQIGAEISPEHLIGLAEMDDVWLGERETQLRAIGLGLQMMLLFPLDPLVSVAMPYGSFVLYLDSATPFELTEHQTRSFESAVRPIFELMPRLAEGFSEAAILERWGCQPPGAPQ